MNAAIRATDVRQRPALRLKGGIAGEIGCRRWALTVFVGALVLFDGAALARAQDHSARSAEGKARVGRNSTWEWRQTELGPVPNEADVVGQPFEDEHGWNYGVVVETPAGRRLWLNGKVGPVFDDFAQAQIADAGLVFEYAFSLDGKRLAYAVCQGGKMRMVVDGEPEQPEQAVRYPRFSPDGRHLTYVIKREGKEYLQIDGVPGPACDTVGGPIEFSPDGPADWIHGSARQRVLHGHRPEGAVGLAGHRQTCIQS